ncbi:MAG: amino acid--[acyl-carrier-protein] ligase [Acetobacteraceae bacterium]|nr:amino acid--[acyl-carrier-protein] ligase [Acetobacteraceae bacterium]
MTVSTSIEAGFTDALYRAGLLFSTGVPGLPGRSGEFEAVLAGLDAFITRLGDDSRAEVMRFPPAMNRTAFERTGYMRGFPQLAGSIHCFCGDDRAHRALLTCIAEGQDWTEGLAAAETVLTPAACYPIYPIIAARGPLPPEGITVDVGSWCFRHEPSEDPARMQMFRMREYVRIGAPDQIQAFRQRWLSRVPEIAATLGLEAVIDLANDPFFGRAGQLKADSQREQGLKFEMLVQAGDGPKPTACMSFNYHQDLFGTMCGLRGGEGEIAHTGCVGFGMERLTLALFYCHGLILPRWPAAVRHALDL